ncbi:MAG: UbiD family decarboxylase [Rhodospirillaceae bacterium]|jgi:2,5-furandicarboxylate decarboxylase 1
MPKGTSLHGNEADTETFRLRSFVDQLFETKSIERVTDKIPLGRIAERLEANPKAVIFDRAGPEEFEIIGNLMADRTRLAAAFGVGPADLLSEVIKRLASPQRTIIVTSENAPCQSIIWEGKDADLTKLPAIFQHGRDGAPYFSSTIDYAINPDTGLTNVGCRRMMLRNRTEAGVDLNSPSDLKAIYEAAARRGENLPISFVFGSHPIDHVAATMRIPVDETGLVANLRGAPLPLVKSVTNEILVPADAECIIEGYLDPRGHVEDEGPFGEFAGYYGIMKQNPLFHVTAITMRKDPLFQVSTIGGQALECTDTVSLNAIKTEAVVWRALQTAIREPVAVYAPNAGAGMFNLRVGIKQRVPGEARNAIAACIGCLANIKNVFVVDEDIDVFNDARMEWALATRFQPDRDLIVEGGLRTLPLDPSLYGSRVGGKAGFDLTIALDRKNAIEFSIPAAPRYEGDKYDSVEKALSDGPKTFEELMVARESFDGREIALELDELRQAGKICRLKEGEYSLLDE